MRRVTYLLFIALFFAGCGTNDEAAQALRAAASKTTAEGSSAFAITMSMSPVPQVGSVSMTGEGAFDYASKRGHMTMDMGEAMGSLAPGGSAQMEAVYDGFVVYMKMPFATQMLPAAKPWIKVDMLTAGEEMGMDLGALSQLGQGDPSSSLGYLAGMKDVEELGREDVRGVSTTRYSGRADLEAVVELAPEDLRSRIQATIDVLKEQLAEDSFPVEVWLDDDERVRRFSQSMEMNMPGSDEPVRTQYTMEMFDFGIEVKVEIPPPSQVMDIDELTSGAAG